ncbi:DNA-3-methyladenine glycosylase I [Aerobium aerolatum]|uniref:DNA-3-methyladenine glycosylase I n=1 Tax=Aquamicrobium aerolatum DSM 21857 TaxID=1121003 RepID=A0A1I3HGM1_9HYPH|nr:DNA-3-methyladenine glycosylase I [Aquamicrobium aerolatum]SFI34781.1 DNA-3-methyladenine glycosylase I [Aquamicrobium aerolatum DSM 21857]
MDGLVRGEDGEVRCAWHGNLPDYMRYHDEEWGKPVADDQRLFEKLCLEGFQSGLSWLTILRKRENFRAAFSGFDYHDLAQKDADQMMGTHLQDAGIVRHRGKIASVYNNARRAVALEAEFGSLASYFWSFEPGPDERPAVADWNSLRAMGNTPTSTRISKELKKRGWSFVGPTTVYAFMQAMGMVNDHVEGCVCRERVEQLREGFRRPAKGERG